MDYLNENYCIFLDQISKIRQRIQNIKIDNENLKKALIEKERVVPEAITNYLDLEQVDEIIKKRQVAYIEKQDSNINIYGEKYRFNYRDVNYYKSEIEELIKDLKKAVSEKKKIYILLETKEKAKKIMFN